MQPIYFSAVKDIWQMKTLSKAVLTFYILCSLELYGAKWQSHCPWPGQTSGGIGETNSRSAFKGIVIITFSVGLIAVNSIVAIDF